MNKSTIFSKRNVLIATHLGALLPALWLLWDMFMGNLTVNPIQDLTFRTGKPALILLILSLAVTPVVSILGWRWAVPARKWLGLYAFFYVTAHFYIFAGLDYGWDLGLLQGAVLEKRYALVGFLAFLILTPLALTSNKRAMRWLGKRWKVLHRGAYLAGIFGVLHYIWLVKSDIREPLAWSALLALLLFVRIPAVRKALVGWRLKLTESNRSAATATASPESHSGLSDAAKARIQQAKQRG